MITALLLVNKIADYLDFVNKTGEDCGLVIKSFGHAGDGNLHIYQCSNDLEEEEFKSRVDKFFEIIYKEAASCAAWYPVSTESVPARLNIW